MEGPTEPKSKPSLGPENERVIKDYELAALLSVEQIHQVLHLQLHDNPDQFQMTDKELDALWHKYEAVFFHAIIDGFIAGYKYSDRNSPPLPTTKVATPTNDTREMYR